MTWLLSALCLAAVVRLAMQPAGDVTAIVGALAVVPSRLTADPLAPEQLVTLVTSSFLHAGWVHLAGNLLYLLVFGPAVEARLGHGRFAGLYLVCGTAGAVAHVLTDPVSAVPLVGASGAIAGVLGAHLVLEPRTRVTTLVPALVIFEIAALPAAFVIALWFVAQLASGLAPVSDAGAGATVAWFAHLGGFAAGCLLAAPVAVRAVLDARARRGRGGRHGGRPHARRGKRAA